MMMTLSENVDLRPLVQQLHNKLHELISTSVQIQWFLFNGFAFIVSTNPILMIL